MGSAVRARRPGGEAARLSPRQLVLEVVRLWDFQLSPATRGSSPFPRPHTHDEIKLARDVRQNREAFDVDVRALRPRTRAECRGQPRPCPWFSCQHHLAFEVQPGTGNLKEVWPHLQIYDHPDGPGLDILQAELGTCALDISEAIGPGDEGLSGLLLLRLAALRGDSDDIPKGLPLEEIGRRLNMLAGWTRTIAGKALRKVRAALLKEGT